MGNVKKLIVIPTYNEVKNIKELLQDIYATQKDVHVLIVDDNSPDGTGKLIDGLIKENVFASQLFVLHRTAKLGLGTAYIMGFSWGLERGYDVFVSMDADFSHNPKYLPEIFEQIKTHDLVIGSRYIKGGGVRDWGIDRQVLSRGGNLYAQMVLLSKVRDLTGGFNCYKSDFLRKIKLQNVISKGYSFQIEMKFRHVLLGAKIRAVPIIFSDRIMGVSKMSGHIFKEAVLNVLLLSFKRFKMKKEMKD